MSTCSSSTHAPQGHAPKKVSPQVKSRIEFVSFPPDPGESQDEAHCHWPWGAAPRPGSTFFFMGPTCITRIHTKIGTVNTHFGGALFRSTTRRTDGIKVMDIGAHTTSGVRATSYAKFASLDGRKNPKSAQNDPRETPPRAEWAEWAGGG